MPDRADRWPSPATAPGLAQSSDAGGSGGIAAVKRVKVSVPEPRPAALPGMRRRTALAAGGAALASAWLTGCGPSDDAGSGGKGGTPPAPRTPGASGTPSRAPSRASTPAAADWSALAKELRGTLVRPQDAAYATDRRLYNTRFDGLRPAAIAYVTGADDIRRCLDFARLTAVTPAVRSGGHSYAGWSSGDGRLVIDVSRLTSISLDGTEATVGAGAKLIDLYGTAARSRPAPAPPSACPAWHSAAGTASSAAPSA
jgi:hypothetical protein